LTREDFTRFVIYARSATDTDGGQAIREQVEACRQFVERENGRVIAECADPAASGMSVEHPGLQQALSLAAAAECDALVVRDLSRISRDPVRCAQIAQCLKDAGAELRTVEGRIGLTGIDFPTER